MYWHLVKMAAYVFMSSRRLMSHSVKWVRLQSASERLVALLMRSITSCRWPPVGVWGCSCLLTVLHALLALRLLDWLWEFSMWKFVSVDRYHIWILILLGSFGIVKNLWQRQLDFRCICRLSGDCTSLSIVHCPLCINTYFPWCDVFVVF